jgi:hypothetical protein
MIHKESASTKEQAPTTLLNGPLHDDNTEVSQKCFPVELQKEIQQSHNNIEKMNNE